MKQKKPTTKSELRKKFRFPQHWAFPTLLFCTVLVTAAQFLLKHGSISLAPTLDGTIFNIALLAGMVLYFLNAVLFILIIKHMDLSIAYPTMSLSFVWVFLVSFFYFKEIFSVWSVTGMMLIILGVIFLGRAAR